MRTSHGRLALVALIALAACGGSGTEPKPTPVGKAGLQKIAGDGQTQRATKRLDSALVGRAYRESGTNAVRFASANDASIPVLIGTPLKGVVVNFVVVDPKCGRAFAGSAITDTLGFAKDIWEGGTKAGDCTMELRYVDQLNGNAVTIASFSAHFNPGEVFQWGLTTNDTLMTTDTLAIVPLVNLALDKNGNVVHAGEYQTRYRRFNDFPQNDDPGPIVGGKIPVRPRDTMVQVWLDSLPLYVRIRH